MEITGDTLCGLNTVCPAIHFLITLLDKLSVICILRTILMHSIAALKYHLFHDALTLPLFTLSPSLCLIYPWLLTAANLCSYCEKNECVLSAWKIIFFTRPPLNCYHVKVQKGGRKKSSLRRGTGMVSVSERGLGPG